MLTFDGRAGSDQAEHQIEQLELNFDILMVPKEAKPKFVVASLIDDALKCWKEVEPRHRQREEVVTQNQFKEIFLEQFFLDIFRLERRSVF